MLNKTMGNKGKVEKKRQNKRVNIKTKQTANKKTKNKI